MSLSDEELTRSVTAHFSKWGEVANVRIDRDDRKRPFAFLQFREAGVRHARTALREAHGDYIDGRRIRVEAANVNRTLRVEGVPENVGEEVLLHAVEEYGPVDLIRLIEKSDDGEGHPPGLGYTIKFFSREDAIAAYHGLKIVKPSWTVTWQPRPAITPSSAADPPVATTVLVRPLNPDLITHTDLLNRFGVHGCIVRYEIVLPLGMEGRVRNEARALICYSNPEEAERALDYENGVAWMGRVVSVEVVEMEATCAGGPDGIYGKAPGVGVIGAAAASPWLPPALAAAAEGPPVTRQPRWPDAPFGPPVMMAPGPPGIITPPPSPWFSHAPLPLSRGPPVFGPPPVPPYVPMYPPPDAQAYAFPTGAPYLVQPPYYEASPPPHHVVDASVVVSDPPTTLAMMEPRGQTQALDTPFSKTTWLVPFAPQLHDMSGQPYHAITRPAAGPSRDGPTAKTQHRQSVSENTSLALVPARAAPARGSAVVQVVVHHFHHYHHPAGPAQAGWVMPPRSPSENFLWA
ncbi:hypothetical protein HK101_008397 [Irineochytrium annulatum]|nr:hypothetical protein HK101_008397 [Irineochytrium annulatum]